MVPPGDQIDNLGRWHHLVAKFATYASGAARWSNVQLVTTPFADLTDVTLAYEDTKLILKPIMPIGQFKAMWQYM